MNSPQSLSDKPFQLGNFRVEPGINALILEGESFRLEPRNMEVLCLLAEAPGKVVLRETIIDQLWGVEHGADESVTRAISVLRKTFRDAGDDAVYIETVPKRGYRLSPDVVVAPLEQMPAPASSPSPPVQSDEDIDRTENQPPQPARKYAAMAASALLLIAGGAAVVNWSALSGPGENQPALSNEQQLLHEQLLAVAAPAEQREENSARVAQREQAAYKIMREDPETAIAIANSGVAAGLRVLKTRARSRTGTTAQDWMNLGELTFETHPQISLEAYRAAAKIDPDQHEIWFRLSKLEEEQAGDLTAAMDAALNAERVAEALLDRLVGLERVASLEAEAGNVASAKKRFEQIVTLNRQQLQKDKNNSIWLQELSVALDGLGSMEMRLGEIDEARKTYSEVLALDRRRAKADPADWDNLRDISISLENLGTLEFKAGNLQAAKSAFEESMMIDRRNLRERPDSLMISRDLASSLSRVSEVNLALGNAEAALAASMEAEQITRLNLAKNPNSAFLKEDLVKCLKNTGKANLALNQPDPAQDNFKSALAIARELLNDDTLDVSVRNQLVDVLGSIAAISNDVAYQTEADLLLSRVTQND